MSVKYSGVKYFEIDYCATRRVHILVFDNVVILYYIQKKNNLTTLEFFL